MKSALLTLLLISSIFCAGAPVDSEGLSRPLPAAIAQENKDFAERVRQAAQECAQIVVEGGSNEGSTLRAQDKAELCEILNRVQPVRYCHLCNITWGEWRAIRFIAADGSELITLSIYDFGNPHTLTHSTKIWLNAADEKRLFKILKWN